MEFKTSNGTTLEILSEVQYPDYVTINIYDFNGEMSTLGLDLDDARKLLTITETLLKLRDQID